LFITKHELPANFGISIIDSRLVSLNKRGNILAYFRDAYSKRQLPPRRIFIAVEKSVTVLYYSSLKIMVTK
jgi:hypothetical protein